MLLTDAGFVVIALVLLGACWVGPSVTSEGDRIVWHVYERDADE